MSVSHLASHGRARPRGILASTLISAIATLLISSATLAGGVPTRIVRIAPAGVEIDASHFAVANHHVAVVWQEDYSNDDLDKYALLRFSSDGGQTWQPIVHLDNGSPSSSMSVDICGGYVFAVSRFPTGDTWSLGLDSRQVPATAGDTSTGILLSTETS